jgi:hypothetical protein
LQGEGPLLTIAQISVALAGFASVVIALRGSGPQAWTPQDRFGLGNVLAASVGTLLGSLLPFPLAYFGWSNEIVWGVTNATFGAIVLSAVSFLAISVKTGRTPPRTPLVFWSFVGSGCLIAAMLLLSAFDLWFPRGPAILLVGLIWTLLAAFAQLATFLLVTLASDS